jgi:hypothetical protein
MNKEILVAILSFFLMENIGSSFLFANQGTTEQKALENYLKTAKAADIQKGGLGGRNEPWKIYLNDGKTMRKAIFKYIDRPERRLNPVSYKREIAAYELTKLFAMDIVPPVVETEILGMKGSLQVFVEGCINESDLKAKNMLPPDKQAFDNTLEEINIFENLTYCKHEMTDTLVDKDTWKVCRVDFMEAFETLSELLPETTISRCSKRLYQGLRLDPNIIEAAIKPYLTPKEIKALLDRRNLILDKLQGLIKSKGEAAVLFDIKP